MSASRDHHPTQARADDCIACGRRLCQFLEPRHASNKPKTRQLKRGERITGGDQECLKFWTIIRGTAAICRAFEDGRRQIIGLEYDGDLVCGLVPDADAPLWLEALDDCTICELDFAPQAADMKDNAAFIASIFTVTHQRLETLSRHVSTLGRLDSRERVILFLAEMSRRNMHRFEQDGYTSLPLSREDIADYLGLNPETVSRVMSRVKKEGLVKFLSPTEYTVPDFAALEACLPIPVPVHVQNPLGQLVLPEERAIEQSG